MCQVQNDGRIGLEERLNHIKASCSVDNWNGYGASALPDKLFQLASKLLPMLREETQIFPIAGGALQFELEWEECEGYNELVLYADGYVELYSEDKLGTPMLDRRLFF